MTIRLEDELVAGMRAHTAGLHPPPDLVERAARHNRRRRLALSLAAAGGGGAVAVVVAAALAAGPAPVAPSAPPRMLSVAQISQRAVGALAANDVEHVVATVSAGGTPKTTEHWYDPVTGRSRSRASAPSGSARGDTWTVYSHGVATITTVDRSSRTWWRVSRPVTADKIGPVANASPDELRVALQAGDYRLAGRETVAGVAAVHLRAEHAGGGSDDLWVAGDSFRILRRVIVKPTGGGHARVDLAFDWQPRSQAVLVRFTVVVPAGFTRVGVPASEPVAK